MDNGKGQVELQYFGYGVENPQQQTSLNVIPVSRKFYILMRIVHNYQVRYCNGNKLYYISDFVCPCLAFCVYRNIL